MPALAEVFRVLNKSHYVSLFHFPTCFLALNYTGKVGLIVKLFLIAAGLNNATLQNKLALVHLWKDLCSGAL